MKQDLLRNHYQQQHPTSSLLSSVAIDNRVTGSQFSGHRPGTCSPLSPTSLGQDHGHPSVKYINSRGDLVSSIPATLTSMTSSSAAAAAAIGATGATSYQCLDSFAALQDVNQEISASDSRFIFSLITFRWLNKKWDICRTICMSIINCRVIYNKYLTSQ